MQLKSVDSNLIRMKRTLSTRAKLIRFTLLTIAFLLAFYALVHLTIYNELPNESTRIVIDEKVLEFQDIERLAAIRALNLTFGGRASFTASNESVAIIVPYRNRLNNLKLFLKHMHPFLSGQRLNYGIYLIEPVENVTFNRGLLMNIGFVEALRDGGEWSCLVFHDVDLLPEDNRNSYSCASQPKHLSSAVNIWNYK